MKCIAGKIPCKTEFSFSFWLCKRRERCTKVLQCNMYFNSFTHKPPFPWLEITTSIGTLVIALLIGHIFHATVNRIAKVEDDYRKMMELKKQAEDADVAKSQVISTRYLSCKACL